MSSTQIIVLVASVLLFVALLVTVLVVWLKRKATAGKARMEAELASDPPIRGPESAVYRGTTGAYSRVSGNGLLALTHHRLLFQKSVGGHVEVPLREVSGVSVSKSFNRSVVANRVHLVVHTHSGDVGFFVADSQAWLDDIRRTTA